MALARQLSPEGPRKLRRLSSRFAILSDPERTFARPGDGDATPPGVIGSPLGRWGHQGIPSSEETDVPDTHPTLPVVQPELCPPLEVVGECWLEPRDPIAVREATLDAADEIMRDAYVRVSALPGWSSEEASSWLRRAERLSHPLMRPTLRLA